VSAAREARAVLDALEARGVTARALQTDSRRVVAGDVFVALAGLRVDARRFISDAVARGAVAVLCEGAVPDGPMPTVPVLGVERLRDLLGELAGQVYDHPSSRMRTLGVTGTNGKTSVSQWIAQALQQLGQPCAVVGTLGSGFPGALEESPNTTPEPVSLQRDLARFLSEGAQACAMEVSSIGLEEARVEGVRFDVAVFTNLTRDHLDYHDGMEQYAAAKARLFAWPQVAHAVLNLDDAFGRELAQRLEGSGVTRIGYAVDAHVAEGCRVERLLLAQDLDLANGVCFDLVADGLLIPVRTPLVGRFNVHNLLAVCGALQAAGVPLLDAAWILSTLTPPAGRMECYGGEGKPLVVVDYAHTPDALAKALDALSDTARLRGGRLVVVFGCGGDRDPGKRPLMGEVAARQADAVILTSDNPRSESPAAILAQIAAGAPAARVIEDRVDAIRTAVAEAAAADVVLVAGKGHEPYQEVAGRRLPYSDAAQVRAALEAWS